MNRQFVIVNDKEYEVKSSLAARLLDFIRNEVGLKGTKEGCSEGECGACTVLVEGKPVDSCLVLVGQVLGKRIVTIEGVGQAGEVHPIQQAFVEAGAVQCGYCTPGMILSTKALLDVTPHPTELEIKEGISGNICRCTGYQKIVAAVQIASKGGRRS